MATTAIQRQTEDPIISYVNVATSPPRHIGWVLVSSSAIGVDAAEDAAWDRVFAKKGRALDVLVQSLEARAAHGETRPLNIDEL